MTTSRSDRGLRSVVRRLPLFVAGGAFCVIAAVEIYAKGEGAGRVPFAGHTVPVHFHADTVFVSALEADVYHVAVAVFIATCVIGFVVSAATRPLTFGGGK